MQESLNQLLQGNQRPPNRPSILGNPPPTPRGRGTPSSTLNPGCTQNTEVGESILEEQRHNSGQGGNPDEWILRTEH